MLDAHIVSNLFEAGIPSKYHSPQCTFASLKLPGAVRDWVVSEDAMLWADEGGTVQVTKAEGGQGVDCAYLIARALLLKGRAALAVTLPRLINLVTARDYDQLTDRKVLVVVGATGTHWRHPVPDDVGISVEWFLRGWLNAGGALLMQGEVPLSHEPSWWPRGLRTTLIGEMRKEWSL